MIENDFSGSATKIGEELSLKCARVLLLGIVHNGRLYKQGYELC